MELRIWTKKYRASSSDIVRPPFLGILWVTYSARFPPLTNSMTTPKWDQDNTASRAGTMLGHPEPCKNYVQASDNGFNYGYVNQFAHHDHLYLCLQSDCLNFLSWHWTLQQLNRDFLARHLVLWNMQEGKDERHVTGLKHAWRIYMYCMYRHTMHIEETKKGIQDDTDALLLQLSITRRHMAYM